MARSLAALEILTTYEPLRQFSRARIALVQGDTEEILLEGD